MVDDQGLECDIYQISLIALSVEKKGVDAVRKVSVFRSVTVSVTLSTLKHLHNYRTIVCHKWFFHANKNR